MHDAGNNKSVTGQARKSLWIETRAVVMEQLERLKGQARKSLWIETSSV